MILQPRQPWLGKQLFAEVHLTGGNTRFCRKSSRCSLFLTQTCPPFKNEFEANVPPPQTHQKTNKQTEDLILSGPLTCTEKYVLEML